MKKYKLLLSISALSASSIAPIITLASCSTKTDTIKAIPEQMLDIQGNVLCGLNKTAVLDAYDTLVVPEDIYAISSSAFKDVFKGETCPIKTIIFNKNLMSIGASAFESCDAITRIDMSNMQDIKLMALRLGTEAGKQSFASTKNSGGKAILPDGITDMQFKWIEEQFMAAGLNKTWFEGQPEEETNVDTINSILTNTPCKTLSEVYQACKSKIDIETMTAEEGHTYVWDQAANRVVLIQIDSETKTDTLIYGPTGYELNTNKWQLWQLVDEDDFDEYNQHSQYLKKPTTTNSLTKTSYSFISGFDCGQNTDVKNVHYFYENLKELTTAKDIIINTSSNKTNVDVSAYVGTDTGDTVTHYGQIGELTVVSNNLYHEYGTAITATVYDGEIKIDADANIEMTYVRDSSVILTAYKQTGTIDAIYTDSSDSAIKIAIEGQGYTIAADHNVADTVYQTTKEEKITEEGGEVQHVFTVTGGAQNEYYETFTDISNASNATNNPEYFEGKTITLNKDYDMSIESATWEPICNYDDDTGVKAFKGTIDGQEHTILNFNLNVSSENIGLINSNAGSIKNLNFKNCSLKNTGGRACLVAVWNGAGNMVINNINFYNCNVSSSASNGFALGYILNSGTTIKILNCYTDSDCWAKSIGTSLYQTGFISQVCNGANSATFEDCEMHLNISSFYAAGSYIGQLGEVGGACPNTTFKRCTSYGDIKIIDGTKGNGPMAGGFIGAAQNNAQTETPSTTTLFENCTNYSKVYSDDKFDNIDSLGGFIGYGNNPKIAGTVVSFVDCVNEGEIGKENTGTSYIPNYAGGFFGRTNGTENITIKFTRCENKGHINATTAGHFMGLLDITTTEAKAARTCTDCTITGTLRTGATRTQITGEPA